MFIHRKIVNCFRKAGISTANQEAAIADEDDPFKDLQNENDALRNLQPDLVPGNVNATSLTDVDAEVFLFALEVLQKFFLFSTNGEAVQIAVLRRTSSGRNLK